MYIYIYIYIWVVCRQSVAKILPVFRNTLQETTCLQTNILYAVNTHGFRTLYWARDTNGFHTHILCEHKQDISRHLCFDSEVF